MKLLIGGYFGCGNIGDEAILEVLLAEIKKYLPGAGTTVLSGDPSDTSDCHNVRSIDRTDLKKIRRELKQSDAFILGGGGILQDVTSSRSLYYYLYLIWLAKRMRKKVILLGHSIGPIKSWLNRKIVRRILKNIDLLTVRDSASLEMIKSIGISVEKVSLTSDLSFILDIPDDSHTKKIMGIEGIQKCKEHLIGLSLRELPGRQSSKWIDIIAKSLDDICAKDCQIVILIFKYPEDIGTARKLMKAMKNHAHVVLRRCRPADMLGVISKMDLMIGMRLHSCIFAAITGTPVIGLSYDPKVSSFLSSIRMPFIEIAGLNDGRLSMEIAKALGEKEKSRAVMQMGNAKLRANAEMNFKLLRETLSDNRKKLMGIGIDDVNIEEASMKAVDLIKTGRPNLITSGNPEILLRAQDDMELKDILNGSSMNIPDGVGVILAGWLKGRRFKARVTGIDLMLSLIEHSSTNGYRIFLLGGREGTADKAADNLKNRYPDLKIAGFQHGYFLNDGLVIEQIRKTSPDILFVGMGSPRQEKWSSKYLKELNVPVVMTIGGSMDVISGNIKRAPLFMRNIGLEWLYRLFKEPKRALRMIKLPVFLYKALKS